MFINIGVGLMLFIAGLIIMPKNYFSFEARITISTLFLMIYWWITRPVHIAVTALLPVLVNSLFSVVPMADVLKNYASQIVVLLLGANILTITWKYTGLDKRIALKVLCFIGTSVKCQLVVWFLLSCLLSTVLPNTVVAAALCPIAYAMMQYVDGENQGLQKKILDMILLMIAWGAGLGGFGTPLGGAMNLVAITHIENYTGAEFMFIDWTVKMFPYLVTLIMGIVIYIMFAEKRIKNIPGSKEYIQKEYKKMGRMAKAQTKALALFIVPVVLSFARPLYSDILPEFKPFFAFLLFGVLAFFINGSKSNRLITWKEAEKNINWGLMILFSGGLAIGNMMTSVGALETVPQLVAALNLNKTLPIIMMIIAFSMFLSNASSNTAAVAVAVPFVIGMVSATGGSPLRYIFLAAAACNCAFLLPTSIRAIPVGYGLDTNFMLKKGVAGVTITFIILTIVGYISVAI